MLKDVATDASERRFPFASSVQPDLDLAHGGSGADVDSPTGRRHVSAGRQCSPDPIDDALGAGALEISRRQRRNERQREKREKEGGSRNLHHLSAAPRSLLSNVDPVIILQRPRDDSRPPRMAAVSIDRSIISRHDAFSRSFSGPLQFTRRWIRARYPARWFASAHAPGVCSVVSDDYDFRSLDLSSRGLQVCESLLRSTFPHAGHLTKQYLDWQYNQNPAGPAIGFNAYHSGDLAAHYVTIPMEGQFGGVTRRGVLSLNTATHPDHQGKKLFSRLAEKTYGVAAAAGYSFVVGVANANSIPGFTRKLGFQLVGTLDARLGLGPPVREADRAPAGFERVWSADALRWRLANPSTRYRLVTQGSTFRVEAPTDRPGVKAHLGEFERSLMPAGGTESPFGFRPMTLWIGIDPAIRWSRSLYGSIPARFRRSPLNLIFRWLEPGRAPLRRDDVRFQALDFDPY